MGDGPEVFDALNGVVGGDPLRMRVIASLSHRDLQAALANAHGTLVVTRLATIAVLKGLLDDSWTPVQAQAWASFVRRGYVAGRARHPIRPLDIGYEAAFEDGVARAVSRLDEIGDAVDGVVSTSEILDLLQLLGQP